MIVLSVIALCVFIFGAYAYGATVVLALGREVPVWGARTPIAQARQRGFDTVSLTLCTICAVWFIVHAVAEFRVLAGGVRYRGVPELIALVLAYSFPPLIMHTVLNETRQHCTQPARIWTALLALMYAIAAATGVYMFLAALAVIPRPQPFGAWSGLSIGLLFTLCSIYSTVLMLRSKPSRPSRGGGLRRTMIGLFIFVIVLFFALTFMHEEFLLGAALDRVSRTLPIYFLVASVYFENRFEFYDLIVKRAAMLVISLLILGAFFAAVLTTLDRLPMGLARPWLFGIALLPVAMVMPWLHARVGRSLDRLWFGREFTPVEAVKLVLSAMQPATDERALIAATEARLTDMFRTPVHILVEDQAPPTDAPVEATIDATAPASHTRLRLAVMRDPESRRLLSEDLALLRSLAGVFGFMFDNLRLQRRRQEQDQLAHELRLQSSRSELKALRAQINPHFLFNALNAIASLIHTDPTRADAAVEQLAEIFRYTLRRSEQEWASLDQELSFIRAYLDVEQARFGKRLAYRIDCDPAAAGAQVPAMLLHTLVENGVKHGIAQVRGAGRIQILARIEDDNLVLEVRDTGPGLHDSGARGAAGEGFGLRSVRDRLHGYFGTAASVELTRDDRTGLTTARVRMPFVREQTMVSQAGLQR